MTLLGIVALLVPFTARASMVPAMDLETLTARAERVVVGEVLSTKSDWDSQHRSIYTRIEVQVAEVWKGQKPTSGRLTIVQPGGAIGDIEMHVHGLASFQAGQRAVLFLAGAETSSHLIGLGQGKRPLRFEGHSGLWMVEGGDRSAAVTRSADGRLQPVGPEAALSLDDLRSRVRRLVTP